MVKQREAIAAHTFDYTICLLQFERTDFAFENYEKKTDLSSKPRLAQGWARIGNSHLLRVLLEVEGGGGYLIIGVVVISL
eukprot:4188533-Amphidinium_carterae.1